MDNSVRRLLLVEDEPNLAFSLEFNLSAEGYDVVLATDGKKALKYFNERGPFLLVILDGMLPEIDGLDVAKAIRQQSAETGILMLTARATENDILRGLETGIDDYVTKPFKLKELLLRISRMAERASLLEGSLSPKQEFLDLGPFKLELESGELWGPQGSFSLTALETGILAAFMREPGRILSREYLLQKVWGHVGIVETRTVDNFIMRIRKYLEADPKNPRWLESVRGRGYRFRFDPSQDTPGPHENTTPL